MSTTPSPVNYSEVDTALPLFFRTRFRLGDGAIRAQLHAAVGTSDSKEFEQAEVLGHLGNPYLGYDWELAPRLTLGMGLTLPLSVRGSSNGLQGPLAVAGPFREPWLEDAQSMAIALEVAPRFDLGSSGWHLASKATLALSFPAGFGDVRQSRNGNKLSSSFDVAGRSRYFGVGISANARYIGQGQFLKSPASVAARIELRLPIGRSRLGLDLIVSLHDADLSGLGPVMVWGVVLTYFSDGRYE
ncbi:MAG: hypothetical protein U1F43_30045 [Myxococcota bacterium]